MQKKIIYLLLIFILLNIVFVFIGAYLFSISSIDTISIWYLRAKAIYLNHGALPLDFLKNTSYLYSHQQYPLLIPYLLYFFYMFIGGINEQIASYISPILYVLVLIVVYKMFKLMNFNNMYSLVLTYIYSMLSPLLAAGGRKHAGEADMYLVLIYWVTLMCAYTYLKSKDLKLYITIILLIIISSQVKAEGIFLSSVLLFLPTNKKNKIFSFALSIIPFIVWRLIVILYHIPNDFHFIFPRINETILRSALIIFLVLKEMVNINNWYFFWPVFIIFITLRTPKSKFIKSFIIPSLTLMSLFFFIFYLFLNISPAIYVPSSIDRILLQLSPFYFIIFGLVTKELITNTELSPRSKKILLRNKYINKFNSILLKFSKALSID